MSNLAVVTPLKDEFNNIPKLFESIKNQTIRIKLWVIVENDSTDGSKEFLDRIEDCENVDRLHVINKKFEDKKYDIGFKYSEVVNTGFAYIQNSYEYDMISYIGLLDSDSFPENNYFEKLINHLRTKNNCGLTSGLLYLKDGERNTSDDSKISGSGRVWEKKCFEQTGFYYGLSPDSITARKAIIEGWLPSVTSKAKYYSRKPNIRVSYSFRGKSDYYNGYTITFALIKSVYYLFKNPRISFEYFGGYFASVINRVNKNPDESILRYNRKALKIKIKNI